MTERQRLILAAWYAGEVSAGWAYERLGLRRPGLVDFMNWLPTVGLAWVIQLDEEEAAMLRAELRAEGTPPEEIDRLLGGGLPEGVRELMRSHSLGEIRSFLRAERLADTSREVRAESMRVNAEFAAVERDPDADEGGSPAGEP